MKEAKRQVFHVLLGIIFIMIIIFLGVMDTAFLLFLCIIAGAVLLHLKLTGKRIPLVDKMLEEFEREGSMPGKGSLWYFVGALISVSLVISVEKIIATIIILALGDAAATIIGRKGRHEIFYNKKKTWEGAAGFLIASLSSVFFVGLPLGVAVSFLCTFAETLPLEIDDNLIIPLVCVVVFNSF